MSATREAEYLAVLRVRGELHKGGTVCCDVACPQCVTVTLCAEIDRLQGELEAYKRLLPPVRSSDTDG